MRTPNPKKGAVVLYRKLRAMGLTRSYAKHCAAESLAYYKPGREHLFNLRRAEYCRRRYFARWGLAQSAA